MFQRHIKVILQYYPALQLTLRASVMLFALFDFSSVFKRIFSAYPLHGFPLLANNLSYLTAIGLNQFNSVLIRLYMPDSLIVITCRSHMNLFF